MKNLLDKFIDKESDELRNIIKTQKHILQFEGEIHDVGDENYTGYESMMELESHANVYRPTAVIPEGMKVQGDE